MIKWLWRKWYQLAAKWNLWQHKRMFAQSRWYEGEQYMETYYYCMEKIEEYS